MSIKFTPAWKDDSGNRIVFPGRNTIFAEEHEARQRAVIDMLWMMPFGLSPDGLARFEEDADGNVDIPHIIARYGRLGNCAIIAGPKLESATVIDFPASELDQQIGGGGL